MKYFVILLSTLLISSNLSFAQKPCLTSDFRTSQYKKNPKLKQQITVFEKNLQTLIAQKRLAKNSVENEKIITIPVVFHVLHNGFDIGIGENVSVDKLESQIEVLNQDFRRKNEDANDNWPQAADTKIRFSLANVDLDGNYFDGITRTLTSIDVFEYQTDSIYLDAMGGKDIWPGYLNIYVCDLGTDDYTQILPAGFSSLPGYPAYLDAVVLHYEVTGTEPDLLYPYFYGRVATHEVGHWLNLQHLWGPAEDENEYSCYDQDDGVTDTPFSFAPYVSCDTGSSCNSEDMAENFMDYHQDSCINLFTQGQTERMHNSIDLAPSRQFLDNPCPQNATKQTIKYYLDAETELVQAIDTVYAINNITNNAEITYEAGKIVMLENGFSVDTASNFLAHIVTCTGN